MIEPAEFLSIAEYGESPPVLGTYPQLIFLSATLTNILQTAFPLGRKIPYPGGSQTPASRLLVGLGYRR